MKTRVAIILVIIGVSGLLLSAAEPPAMSTAFKPPTPATGTNPDDLNMNFVTAPLEQVLAYLSDVAGFIVAQETSVRGNVTIRGTHITKDQAVNLLNSELNRNNYAAIREGRMLTIMNKNDARTSRIPVLIGNNPTNIPNSDEIATWIIPIRFVEARQLVSDLSLFVSRQATVIANEAANSIVITDTQANIRHLVQIIQLVDGSAEAETEIRVFPLKYASPVDVADELTSMFPGSGSSDSQAPFTFGGGPTPFPDIFGTTTSGSQDRIQKATQVTAVADSRIQAVIVTAPKNLMNEISSIMGELDVASHHDETVATIQLQNADPQQVAQVLQDMFGSSSASSSSQNSALQQRGVNGVTTMGQTTTSSSMSGASSSGGGSGGGRGN
jgi:general secretion pathway protein D